MKQPDESHPIHVAAGPRRVRVRFAGRDIADSVNALVLHEAGHAPVLYLPREDVDPAVLEPSGHTTHCPYKGDASYWSLCVGAAHAKDAVWCYEDPYPWLVEIRGRLAFYPDRVDAIHVED